MTARLILAAPHSGSGKTLLTAGLIGVLRRRGLAVQPFKCGPDYIDPGYHALAAGRPCRNLDTWLLDPAALRDVFARAVAAHAGYPFAGVPGSPADIAVIEGVMGLFDGAGALDDAGSTADVARLLDAPVVLVINARGMARSAAALVAGFAGFDPRVRIGGVLLNCVGSARHADLCATAIAEHTGLPCFGFLPRRDQFKLPERHLGLVTTAEDATVAEVLDGVAACLAESCDLDGLLALARSAPAIAAPSSPGATAIAPASRPLIAVARDRAFSFAYPEMCELLEAAGAIVAPFSPIGDQRLPPGAAGIILSGGFPELYAAELSANDAMRSAIRAAHAAGTPIYAECGGLMYLTEEIVDQADRAWPMVGLVPGRSRMAGRVALGYRTVRAAADGPLLPAGATIRGHEFHYSRWEDRPAAAPPAYHLVTPDGAAQGEGFQSDNLIASYIHLHWLARPAIAERFVAACRAAQD